MNLNYSHQQLATIFGSPVLENHKKMLVKTVSTDTRTLVDGKNTLFFALNGKRKGTDFLKIAYELGCRQFVVQKGILSEPFTEDCIVYEVNDVLFALQELAKFHRKNWSGKLLAITGSSGKTIVKEWLYHVLQDEFNIVRSPKSYNSQLGVALSLLELNEKHNLAIIEAGISKKGEMQRLEEIIQPDYGILTNIGTAHDNGFASLAEKWQEKTSLFQNTEWVVGKTENVGQLKNGIPWQENDNISYKINSNQSSEIELSNWGKIEVPFSDKISLENATQLFLVLKQLNIDVKKVLNRTKTLSQLALRMEILEGKNNNKIINDTYNLELDSLQQALLSQQQLAGNQASIVVIGFTDETQEKKSKIEQLLAIFDLNQVFFCTKIGKNGFLSFEEVNEKLNKINDAIILFKGAHQSGLEELVRQQSLKHHTTYLEIDRQAIRHNLAYYQEKLQGKSDLLVMIKAGSYGSGSVEMAQFLIDEGVRYFGVAYADEGIELRKAGIEAPILIMNAETEAFDDIIRYKLQPAIFSLEQLDQFTRVLIDFEQKNYPIHIKLETGMKRLGFEADKLKALVNYVKAQPELRIQSVYSHLAEAGNKDGSFTELQIDRFKSSSSFILDAFNYPIKRHICNTEGIANYPEAHFEMVRLGIGLFGVENTTVLRPALSFKTHISQINKLEKGESLGYNRSFIAEKEEEIAVLPVGYADGLRRLLGNGKGFVLINGQKAPIVGNVCMDMCFVLVTGFNVKLKDEVELFGTRLPVSNWEKWLDTISYEILTSISPRVKRVWVE